MMTKGEKTRQFIIEQSAVLLNKKGMAGTSVSDIMEATKLAKGGIYGNFQNKEEICQEVFSYLYARLSKRIDAKLQEHHSYKGKLLALLDFYEDTTPMEKAGGCPMINFGAEADDTDQEMRARVATAIKASQARITRLVAGGIANGEFSASINPQAFAAKMFAMYEGAVLVCKVLDNNEQMRIITDALRQEINAFST
ncbi:TetR/AcrR family transcriptional regulator [Chitinophaga sp. Cy-1792]|uniref:TetR/AcrR family transcriptional regulator n=1 Tax=Chitinophaga sp. Cy-1792 TaxID=2608339 RepID=UPI001423D798|nr:TetR family transcriptional regulator [Chitinophaga sp. Cy-1792]NIG55138.1 TetR/AcrR family transcriptional regulator [Chitinophaga sp. Cy-1792]